MLGGIVLLYLGAELLVSSSALIARHYGIHPAVIGATVVAYGTSMPEVVVCVEAAWHGRGDLAVANVIGSNICNIGVVLGLAAVIRPLTIERNMIRRHVPVMILSTLLLLVLLLDGEVSRVEGATLLCLVLAYSWSSLIPDRFRRNPSAPPSNESLPVIGIATWIRLGGGLMLLVAGGEMLITGGVGIARDFGVSEAIIGLTAVALGTSCPDIWASAVAAFRGHGSMAAGNAVGSVTFNCTSAIGFGALASPLAAPSIGIRHGLVMIGFAVLTLLLMRGGLVVRRRDGILLLAGYIVYLLTLV